MPKTPDHEQKDQGEELLDPQLQLPHGQHGGKKNDAGEQQHGQGEPVHAVVVGDAQRGNPIHVLHELKAAGLLVVGRIKVNGNPQGQSAEHGADDLDGPCLVGGNEQNRHQAHAAAEQ